MTTADLLPRITFTVLRLRVWRGLVLTLTVTLTETR
jgi:hypothetical protein